MPEENVNHQGVNPELIATFKADTLEELAAKLEITDVTAFIEEIQHYNEMVDNKVDTDFGVPQTILQKIDQPPYYGIHRNIRLTHADSGVEVNGQLQCLDISGQPISGLYAAGNVAGNFYGGNDYPLDVLGLNLGHNYTEGYFLGKMLASN